MAEQVVDEKSDDLDIVSTGKLYQGPWEKKYWSSSRGKDRHPYPVGYIAHRTYNGNTYKMAVLEGLKGPEFAISCTDGESCSGQTPDIAWEGFQKKSCVRIKFWRGKRFSCKIDGSELFGFKNPLVARLLRGLKANASPIVENTLPSSCFDNEQSKGTHEEPDLEMKLVKTEGKEKRSKKRKELVHVKSVSGTQHKRERPQDVTQSGHHENDHSNGIPLHLLSTEDELQFDSSVSSENLEKEKKCPAVVEASISIGSKDVISVVEEGVTLLKHQQNLDTLEPTCSKTADEKGDPPVQKGSQMMGNVDLYAPDTLDPALEDEKGDPPLAKKDSQVLDDVDLCAPDTSDSTLDSTCNRELEIPKESSCCINDKSNATAQISVSEKSVTTESQSKDGSDNSYRSDSDSIGQDITNSMMTLLLPRALPLLKTYSRKKKKKNVYEMSQEERKGTNQCLEDSTAIAPDSFENHQCEPPPMEETNEGHHVCSNLQLSEEQVWHVGQTTNKTKSSEDVDLVLEKSPQKGTATAVDAKSTNPVDLNSISTHSEMTKTVHNDEEVKDGSHSNNLTKMGVHYNDDLQNVFELVGCYVHPTPISTVILHTKGNEVFICVLCGYLMEKDRTLFAYKTSINGKRKGHPSFIGHTKITSPISKTTSGDQIIQFTPDGQSLVLLNNINAPYCREGGVNCKFSACTPDGFEKNAVKVVQVKVGYVHVVCKLNTTNNVCCILVCEPSYLVAADESGSVNLWTMNSTWSASTEHSYLPTSDCMPNSITEMKRIPNFPSLVVGLTAFGDFCLWDLTRRILVSKFSAPGGTSFLPFLPINIFRCPKKKQVADIQRWSLETDNHEDVSLVLLVSNIDSGYWSLALLAKNKLVLLNAFDPSTRVAGASAGYGIIGTCDGCLYIWELSSGTKLGYLSHCRGATVSCLAVDNSDSGVFAVAVDGSQLQVYAKNH